MDIEVIIDTTKLQQLQSEQLKREIAVLNYLVYHQDELQKLLPLAELNLFAFRACQNAFDHMCGIARKHGQVDYWLLYSEIIGPDMEDYGSRHAETLYVENEDFPFSEERTTTGKYHKTWKQIIKDYRLRRLADMAAAVKKMVVRAYDPDQVEKRVSELAKTYRKEIELLKKHE